MAVQFASHVPKLSDAPASLASLAGARPRPGLETAFDVDRENLIDVLRALRDELAMIDEQLAQLVDAADDLALRALVAETPAASYESNDARKHADAMRRHRAHVVEEITRLEVRQDELLDRLTSH